LHRTDLIIFPLTLQTITIAPMMSVWGKGGGVPDLSRHWQTALFHRTSTNACLLEPVWCIYEKTLAAGVLPRTPLGELTTLPQTLKLDPWWLANVAITIYVPYCGTPIMVTLNMEMGTDLTGILLIYFTNCTSPCTVFTWHELRVWKNQAVSDRVSLMLVILTVGVAVEVKMMWQTL